MKIAVMQPYLFPYIGYFQLIYSVDLFVFFDDVNFIKRGWINRNKILINHEASLFSVPLNKASQNKVINQIYLSLDDKWIENFIKKIEFAYKSAPYYRQVSSLIIQILTGADKKTTIAELAINSTINILGYIGIEKHFLCSSEINYCRESNGQGKILSICKELSANHYVNPINGHGLYQFELFNNAGVKLSFLKMDENLSYTQFSKDQFVPFLSIIDVLMFNEPGKVQDLLSKYELTGKKG